MKFWQKTFLSVLLLFLVGFGSLLVSFLSRGGSLNEQLITQSAQTEMDMMRSAIETKLRSVSAQHVRFTPEALRVHLRAYSEIYGHESAFFQIENEEGERYSSLDDVWMDVEGTEGFQALGERLFYAQTGSLWVENMSLSLSLLKDVSILNQYRSEMLRFGIIACAVLAALLGGMLLLLLLGLTRPLKLLTKTTRDIAQGQLDKRVSIKQKDEIGEFAASFNQMADAVQRQMTDLEESNAQRQWFIDSLSHELRTPVTAIVGYGELLQYANVSQPDREKALTYIVQQGNRIKNLSEKLLDLARLQHEQIEMRRVDLDAVVRQAAQSLWQFIEKKHIRFPVEGGGAYCQGDEALLETLALNLLENAVRASGEGKGVLVRTEMKDGRACLTVRDEGIGIAPEEQRRIMEPFYRVDPSRSRKNGGVGLGLTLCRQICFLHGAALSIESAPGEGCAVTIEFTSS